MPEYCECNRDSNRQRRNQERGDPIPHRTRFKDLNRHYSHCNGADRRRQGSLSRVAKCDLSQDPEKPRKCDEDQERLHEGSSFQVGFRRNVQLVGNVKLPNDKLVNFQPLDSGAANRQFTDGKRANCQCTDSHRPQCKCANRLGSDSRPAGIVRAQELGLVAYIADELPGPTIASTQCHVMILGVSYCIGLYKRCLTIELTGRAGLRRTTDAGHGSRRNDSN